MFFDLACCFLKNKIYSDIEIWSPLLKRLSNFSNLESYFMFALFAFKSKVSIQVIFKMIQWRFCAAKQQVLILNFAPGLKSFLAFWETGPWPYPEFSDVLLSSILPVKKHHAIQWINFHPIRVCHNIEVFTILHHYTSSGSISDLVDSITPSNEIPRLHVLIIKITLVME